MRKFLEDMDADVDADYSVAGGADNALLDDMTDMGITEYDMMSEAITETTLL